MQSGSGTQEPIREETSLNIQYQRRRICGRSKLRFTLILLVLAFAIIALTVGLGVGLGLKRKSSPDSLSSDSTSNSTGATSELHTGPFGCMAKANSTESAIQDSGVALITRSRVGFYPDYPARLFYQDPTGQLRQRKLVGERSWSEEKLPVEIFAKKGTTLAAAADYVGIHLFYLDQDSHMKELVFSNKSVVHHGPLDAMDPPVGLAANRATKACGFGYWTRQNGEPVVRPGYFLYFASNKTTLQGWLNMNGTWHYRSSIPNVNTTAGLYCFIRPDNPAMQFLFASTSGNLEVWTDNYNNTLPKKDCQVPVPTSFINHETYIGASEQFFYSQDDKNRILYRNVSLKTVNRCNETVSFDEDPLPVSNTPALPGTTLSQAFSTELDDKEWQVAAFQTQRQGVTVYSFEKGVFTGGADIIRC
ncbi:hypothetical protein K470DRAFT_257398 [Piedraia hortae CBS 480.64]|uniref:Fucose-specific lectin n=1 Tax=Piedraia hortae CBS 480.64 TaxID=1314780 RepID=A0A6A7C209_9PEZI|nr:hypothetical protein K470DRAFT_257398 [Piedraia hortae CBS 480.64]